MLYHLVRPLLFSMDPERSHFFAMRLLRLSQTLKLWRHQVMDLPVSCLGLSFKNPVGLGAGFDKNGDYIDLMGAMGFGFIEIGTVTPLPQPGNARPRLFRLQEADALINRMGFNNKGADYLVERVRRSSYQGILGINIGKNAATALDRAVDDYALAFKKVYPYADYITVNISSPNTRGLRALQEHSHFDHLTKSLKLLQETCAKVHQKRVPILIKVAPDLTEADVVMMADIMVKNKMDGLIATNTTLERTLVKNLPQASEQGGLSGLPLARSSTDILKLFHRELKGGLPIIGSGGIMSPTLAKEKILAGASLLQLYTGLIYHGPHLISKITRYLAANPVDNS